MTKIALGKVLYRWAAASESRDMRVFLIHKSRRRAWIFYQIFLWPDGPWHKSAGAVRAFTKKVCFCAVLAKRALITADTNISIIGRKVNITAFAIRLQYKHVYSSTFGGCG